MLYLHDGFTVRFAVPFAIGVHALADGTKVYILFAIVIKSAEIKSRVGRMARYSWNGHQHIHPQIGSMFELCAGMESLIVKSGELVVANDVYRTLHHIAHGLRIVFVGYQVINREVVFVVNGGLNIITDFGNVVAGNQLPAIGV